MQSKDELRRLLEEKARRERYQRINYLFPDEGKFRRELYPKHIAFFDAGSKYLERCFMAGNRTGKTVAGAFEFVCHLTGIYPNWWKGRMFDHPIDGWVIGKTSLTTRDILQKELMGDKADIGSGLIPKDFILSYNAKAGTPDGIDTVRVKHVSGGVSVFQFKSSDQGDESFYGTSKDVIWLDEEARVSVYMHCLKRTMTTKGLMYVTFTPEQGLSEMPLLFMKDAMIMEGELTKERYVTRVTWDEVPHLTPEDKERLWNSLLPHMREAASKGIPAIGSGAIYPIDQDSYKIKGFPIPEHFERFFSMDFGWNRTAVLWLAYDRANDTLYAYDEWYRGETLPEVHVMAIQARGKWIEGVCDPAGGGRNQENGKLLRDIYRDMGLSLYGADNSVETGIVAVYSRLSTGRLKIFSNCQHLLAEMRIYRRDDKGQVVKKDDHLCDCLRYGVMSGLRVSRTDPALDEEDEINRHETGRNKVAGY